MSLIAVEELAASLDDPDLRIADVRWSLAEPDRGRLAYAQAHLPGAVFVDLDTVLTAREGPGRHPLPDPRGFVEALAALGIGRQHRVVAYDDSGGTVAARLWWMLEALSHEHIAVLDGGIGAWRTAGLPLTAAIPELPRAQPIAIEASRGWPGTIDREWLAGRLGDVTLLDARAPERYRGEVEPIDRVPGHIPTARSLPTLSLLGDAGIFLAPTELAARFAAAGIRPVAADDDESAPGLRRVVVSCGSGVNACHLALGMRAAGLADPLLYPGSYSDWTQSGLPVATGPEPGAAPGG